MVGTTQSVDNSPGNVPPNSYMGHTYNQETKKYYKPSIAKSIFFKATQILCKMKDGSWFTQNEDRGENLWERQKRYEYTSKSIRD